jgi:hypothetical protein
MNVVTVSEIEIISMAECSELSGELQTSELPHLPPVATAQNAQAKRAHSLGCARKVLDRLLI